MKKYLSIFLVFLLSICLFSGCRSQQNDATVDTNNTTNLLPDMNDMIPDAADTIDPSNGENRDTTPTTDPENAPETLPSGTNGAENGLDDNNRRRVIPRQ